LRENGRWGSACPDMQVKFNKPLLRIRALELATIAKRSSHTMRVESGDFSGEHRTQNTSHFGRWKYCVSPTKKNWAQPKKCSTPPDKFSEETGGAITCAYN